MAKKSSKFLLQQKIVIGVIAAVAAGVLIYLSTLVLTDIPLGEYEEGVHYQLLEKPRRMRGDKIEVTEFFSYGCIHCYNLESDLEPWIERNREQINFVRSPAFTNSGWRTFARSYFTTEHLGITEDVHLAFFHEIHDKGRNLNSIQRLADFFDGKGTSKEAYTKAYSSSDVARRLAAADQLQRRYKVANVPTLIVHGKYIVKTTRQVGRSRLLDVVDFLVEKELADKKAATNS